MGVTDGTHASGVLSREESKVRHPLDFVRARSCKILYVDRKCKNMIQAQKASDWLDPQCMS